jgi:hypothetical protein
MVINPNRRNIFLGAALATATSILARPAGAQGTARSNIVLGKDQGRVTYALDAHTSGIVETINNIANLTVVSKNPNDLKAEYRAGFVQGKLQAKDMVSARDNSWDLSYLLDPAHAFPQQPGPTRDELARVARLLNSNYNALIYYLSNSIADPDAVHGLKRLLFRMVGIYHGATLKQPASLNFGGRWLPDGAYFKLDELGLGYETASLTFMDVYYLNAGNDLAGILTYSKDIGKQAANTLPDKCSAFLKRVGTEVIVAHNTWMGFLSQTMVMTLAINDDLISVNAGTPGLIGSSTDFGFNNKGIIFNETTHRMAHSEVKPDGIWIFWRAALAEQFSTSIDDFFRYISIDNSGTYLNGYMLADTKNGETGLVEMSYRCFVFYRSNGGPYTVTSISLDGQPSSTEYDHEMVTPEYLLGFNYPASIQVRKDLQSTDSRPARRRQLAKLILGVVDDSTAKAAITYIDPANPLSVFGRWDLGYGESPYPIMIPDGAVDAKTVTTAIVRSFMSLSGKLDMRSKANSFWMLYGTPIVNGSPFVWSQSSWKWQKLRDVPDRLDGTFTLIPLHLT